MVLIEAQEVGWAASGRNGGFCEASLSHGLGNGHQRWPRELAALEQLGARNLQAMEDAVKRYGIACDWERTGSLSVATEPYQVDDLRELAELAARYGVERMLLDTPEAVRAERFAAEVLLDQLAGARTERTQLQLVRRKPVPFPPEPVRSAGIGITKWSLARADANGGRWNGWLRTLDRLGLGFDS